VERLNKFLKSSLKKVVEDTKNWSTQFNVIQYVINTYHSSINASPSKILFGVEIQNQADTELIRFLNGIVESELSFEQDRDVARQLALETTNEVKEYNKLYDGKHKKPSEYNPGDYVLIRDSTLKLRESKKLKPKYKNPYMVTKILIKIDVFRIYLASEPHSKTLSRFYQQIG